jgi:hypothetical protein
MVYRAKRRIYYEFIKFKILQLRIKIYPLLHGITLALYQDIFSPLLVPLPTGERGSLPVGRQG